MSRAHVRFAAVVSLATLGCVGAAPARAASVTAHVTYLAGASIYVDAGSLDGLRVGDTLRVVRDGVTIAQLRAAFASSHRASCDTLSTSAVVRMGDAVVFSAGEPVSGAGATAVSGSTAAGGAPATGLATEVAGGPAAAPRRAAGAARVRGRIGGRWLDVRSVRDGASATSFNQPSLDVRLDATRFAGIADFSLDARGRRTVFRSEGTQTTDAFTRVYRATLRLHDEGDHLRLTLGRQTSSALTTISLFDGALAEWDGSSVAFGAFGGSQPEPMRLGFSADIVEYGVYAGVHQPPLSGRRWFVNLGGVTSTQAGQPNRDFLFTQSGWISRGLAASFTQELDVNRGWKRTAGEPATTFTNTFASARVPLARWSAVQAGYDNRRNVRLYRDRLTPETEFDDRYRQGAWLGGSLEPLRILRFSGDVRRSDAAGDRADSWSLSGELWRISRFAATLRARVSRYQGTLVDSRLTSFGLALDPVASTHFELNGGIRQTGNPALTVMDHERWEEIAIDASLAGRWYLSGSIEHDHGDAGATWQHTAGISWRF